MNDEQRKAARSLERALKKCSEAGLSGGVYCAVFCVWPSDSQHPESLADDFFANVRVVGGEELNSYGMQLDGGAGT